VSHQAKLDGFKADLKRASRHIASVSPLAHAYVIPNGSSRQRLGLTAEPAMA
jgi:hypothetical protein